MWHAECGERSTSFRLQFNKPFLDKVFVISGSIKGKLSVIQ